MMDGNRAEKTIQVMIDVVPGSGRLVCDYSVPSVCLCYEHQSINVTARTQMS